MGLRNIEIEQNEDTIFITNESKVQMYAGDPGTKVYSTVELTLEELGEHIKALMLIRQAMPKGGEG